MTRTTPLAFGFGAAMALLGGCAAPAGTAPALTALQPSAIHHRYRPVIEDRRAGAVGDVVMISIREGASAGAASVDGAFDGTIAATVVEVRPHGMLRVVGSKLIGAGQGAEIVRFSGTVNIATLSAGNVVSSTLVSNAQLEHRTRGTVGPPRVTGWLSRYFLSAAATY